MSEEQEPTIGISDFLWGGKEEDLRSSSTFCISRVLCFLHCSIRQSIKGDESSINQKFNCLIPGDAIVGATKNQTWVRVKGPNARLLEFQDQRMGALFKFS